MKSPTFTLVYSESTKTFTIKSNRLKGPVNVQSSYQAARLIVALYWPLLPRYEFSTTVDAIADAIEKSPEGCVLASESVTALDEFKDKGNPD